MAKVKTKDIVAYKRANKLYCPQCAKDERLESVSLDEVITKKDMEDSLETIIFCDVCKERIEF